jgi:DNA primase catalytic core
MPLTPREEIERIKREISVQRLAEARGIKLKRSGKELIGLCPFHKDKNPSLNIDPAANVWHCKGACGEGGDVIQWVMRAEGISFRHALEMLRRDLVPLTPLSSEPPKKSTTVKLPPLVGSEADDRALLKQVVGYYQQTLKESPEALKYLESRGLKSSEMIDRFRLGYANRTIGYRLPALNRNAGAELRGRLQRTGIYRESGHEHFTGSLVIPILNPEGEVMQMYGRKITRMTALRDGTPAHLYLPGPHRGVWNEEALIATKEIILCEALIDALTFWCAGFRNVTTSYGVNGFTDEIKAALLKHSTKRIFIAYDRDEAGERAAHKHSAELMEMGLECFRVMFPKGMDANEYALKVQSPDKSLGVLVHSAEWLGKGKRPTVRVMELPRIELTTPPPEEAPAAKEEKATQVPEPAFSLADDSAPEETETAAKEKISAEEIALPQSAETAEPEERAPHVPVEVKGEEVTIMLGDRRYRVLGLQKNMSHGVLKVNVFVSRKNGRGELVYFGDTFDLYSARPRLLFSKQAAQEIGTKEETIRRELGVVWMTLEDMQRQQIEKALAPEPEEPTMTPEEKAAALDLLRDPRLLDRVLEDFNKCGVVGEETNKQVSYLAAVSRLLEKPLAIVVQSSSAAGKSSLMEAVLDFMPEEQRESYSAMTGQALFYMGQKNLKHKILAVSEEEGASRASYPLKLLQSEGILKIASTGKDPISGKLVTHEYIVEGPVMIFLTTTAQQVDEELINRAVVLAVNEEREQTRAIHRQQREARTIEGHLARRRRAKIVRLHRNAQRLLRPIAVVNNHALADFPDYMTRTRRDHAKVLTLIEAIALLHQHQREIKSVTCDGETLEYIEATEDDVRLAQELADKVVKPSLDELRPQTRTLLALIVQMVAEECEQREIEPAHYRFTRRTVREYTRWGDTQLRAHLARLEEMEYLLVRRGGNQGQLYVYQLRASAEEARRNDNFAGLEGDFAGGARELRGPVKNDESPAMTRLESETSRVRGNAYRGSGLRNGVVAQSALNGRAK